RDREIPSSSTQPIKENEGNPPIVSPLSYETEQFPKEDENNYSNVEEKPEDNTRDQKLQDTSCFAKISSNLQTLLQPLLSLFMPPRNSTSSTSQPTKYPVINRIDGIRNILFVFIPVNIILTILSTATIINSIKTEQSSNSNSSSQVTKYEPKYRNLE
ncbi:MAG: protein phosphatase 2C family protein, partial [Microcystis panniformis]